MSIQTRIESEFLQSRPQGIGQNDLSFLGILRMNSSYNPVVSFLESLVSVIRGSELDCLGKIIVPFSLDDFASGELQR